MNRWPAGSMTEILFAFMLAALVVGGVIEIARLLGRMLRQAVLRRRARSELSGDWWPHFEEELNAFSSPAPRTARAQEHREPGRPGCA